MVSSPNKLDDNNYEIVSHNDNNRYYMSFMKGKSGALAPLFPCAHTFLISPRAYEHGINAKRRNLYYEKQVKLCGSKSSIGRI